jgi:cytochrome c oxidase subunit 1
LAVFATTLIIAVPTAIKVYNWVLTLWRGNIHLTVPMLFAIGFIFAFIHGGLTGLFLGNATVAVPLSDTMFVVAHFHMVMAVAPIMVVFGAIYHWYPKITGRMFNETLGKILGHLWHYAIYRCITWALGVPRGIIRSSGLRPIGTLLTLVSPSLLDRGRIPTGVLVTDLELFQRQAGG